MKKSKTTHIIEYLSFTLILSYFFVHNIFLVLIGITFSIYLININYINTLIRSLDKTSISKKVSIELNKNDKLAKSNSIQIDSDKEDKKLTLVETIEELGFIPSIDKNNDSEAA